MTTRPSDPLRNWPSVTQILEGAGLIDTANFTQESRDRGTAVHRACEYLDGGDLDLLSVDPAVTPYLDGYRAFLAAVKPEILAVEEFVQNDTYRYVGHLDRRVRMNGRESIIDIKTGGPAEWHPVQTAGYAGCFPQDSDKIPVTSSLCDVRVAGRLARYSLYLTHNGGYKLVEHVRREDWKVFLAALTIHNWRAR